MRNVFFRGRNAVLAIVILAASAGAVQPADAAPAPAKATATYQKTLHSTGWIVVAVDKEHVEMGTCWVIDREKKLVITNQHVVEDHPECIVYFPSYAGAEVITNSGYYLKNVQPISGKVRAVDKKTRYPGAGRTRLDAGRDPGAADGPAEPRSGRRDPLDRQFGDGQSAHERRARSRAIRGRACSAFRRRRRSSIASGSTTTASQRLVPTCSAPRYRGVLGINLGRNFDTPNERAADDYRHRPARGLRAGELRDDQRFVAEHQRPARPAVRRGPAALLATLKRERGVLADAHGRRVPLVVKLAPDLSDDALRGAAQRARRMRAIDGVIATNTTLARDRCRRDARMPRRRADCRAPRCGRAATR